MWILSRILSAGIFAGPKMVHPFSFADPNVARWPLASIWREPPICLGKIIADALVKFEVAPSPFASKRELTRHRRENAGCCAEH